MYNLEKDSGTMVNCMWPTVGQWYNIESERENNKLQVADSRTMI